MKTMIVNGKEIKTNYESSEYAIWNGNDYPKTMKVFNVPFGKTTKDVLYELVEEGYTKIRFVEMTTCVRGYHKVYAFAK